MITRLEIFASPVHLCHMPSTDRMREFLEVVKAGSISEAARVLGLPRATLSRRMSGLEADLNVRLLHRRTTRLVLTDAGHELARRAVRIVEDADAAWVAVQRLDDIPRGLLRVSVTGPHFLELFTDFLCDFPEVQIEVQSTTRHVDLLAEGVDVAIRIGEIKDQNLIARRVHSDRTLVVATPEFLNSFGTPTHAKELAKFDCIVGFSGDWAPSRRWPLTSGGTIPVGGRLAANEIELVLSAAKRNLGLALLPSAVVAPDINAGTLIPVLVDEVGVEIPISLVYADREYIDPKIRIFVDRAAKIVTASMPKPYLAELK
jgi:DNA-binding transcriptional LysR family regulator